MQRFHICNGAILDATLIEAKVKSRAKPKLIVEDRHEDDDSSGAFNTEVKELQANKQAEFEIDKDAKWLKKGKSNVFGYKNFITTDIKDGYIESIHMKPANASEVTNLEQALSKVNLNKLSSLYTDKGYASADNRKWLNARKINDNIMYKAARNTPLTKDQIAKNKQISKVRYIVERTNATIKNIFNFAKTRYIGLEKVNCEVLLVAMAHNLLKAANKITMINHRIIVSNNCSIGLFA